MKFSCTPCIVTAAAFLVLGILAFVLFPPKNPDPNHTHADFAVWIGERQLDFSDAKYMSGSSTDPTREDARHSHLHLHDGNGHVIHFHTSGLTIGAFFESIGLKMTLECLMLDSYQMDFFADQYQAEQQPTYSGFKIFYKGDRQVCSGAMLEWHMFVNGEERPFDPSYQPNDLDHILLSYNNGEVDQTDVNTQLDLMTNEACLYSQTCPWRGKPPMENCIADPGIPCAE